MNAPSVPTDLSFVWLINETNITITAPSDSRFSIVNDQEVSNRAGTMLMLTDVEFSDNGTYTCLVHNREPQDGITSTTEVKVVGQ